MVRETTETRRVNLCLYLHGQFSGLFDEQLVICIRSVGNEGP